MQRKRCQKTKISFTFNFILSSKNVCWLLSKQHAYICTVLLFIFVCILCFLPCFTMKEKPLFHRDTWSAERSNVAQMLFMLTSVTNVSAKKIVNALFWKPSPVCSSYFWQIHLLSENPAPQNYNILNNYIRSFYLPCPTSTVTSA